MPFCHICHYAIYAIYAICHIYHFQLLKCVPWKLSKNDLSHLSWQIYNQKLVNKFHKLLKKKAFRTVSWPKNVLPAPMNGVDGSEAFIPAPLQLLNKYPQMFRHEKCLFCDLNNSREMFELMVLPHYQCFLPLYLVRPGNAHL